MRRKAPANAAVELIKNDSGIPNTDSPVYLRLTCLASLCLFLMVLALVLSAWTLFGFRVELFGLGFVVFLLAWAILLGYPSFKALRDSALNVLHSITNIAIYRAEAMEAAARASLVELRSTLPNTETRFIPVKGAGSFLRDLSTSDSIGGDLEHRQILLPNQHTLPATTLVDFIDGAFSSGLGLAREAWVPDTMSRLEYDGLMQLLQELQIVENRRAGTSGVPNIDDAETIKKALGLA